MSLVRGDVMPVQQERILNPDLSDTKHYAVALALNDVHAQTLCLALNKRLNGQVRRVEVGYSYERNEKLVAVLFINNHLIVRPYDEVLTDEFIATCMMLYDLPRKPSDDT